MPAITFSWPLYLSTSPGAAAFQLDAPQVPAPFSIDSPNFPTALKPGEVAAFSVGFHPTKPDKVYGADVSGTLISIFPVTDETVFQTHVGGHVYDRGVDGSECRWARVLALDPPHRVVISWDISPRWQLEPDPARASEVEVRFIELGPEHTRVEIEHRHIDRHGDGWRGEAAALAADDAWPLYLRRFADVVAGVGVSPR